MRANFDSIRAVRAWCLVGLLWFAISMTLPGCATADQDAQDRYDRPTRGDVSSIPWNRPQGWEGQSGIPGMGGNIGTR